MRWHHLCNNEGYLDVIAASLYRYRQSYLSYPQIVESVNPQLQIPPTELIEKLSFTHLPELIAIDLLLLTTLSSVRSAKSNLSAAVGQ